MNKNRKDYKQKYVIYIKLIKKLIIFIKYKYLESSQIYIIISLKIFK